jgi:pimeloyl-ACP methyl ester carboxylesterase
MATRHEAVRVWQERVPFRIRVEGQGPPVVFFHGPWGPTWGAFLEPDAIHAVDALWDLVLCYDEVLDRLGLSRAAFVGHSFGAMVACEVAALRPGRAGRLVLIDPIGLWRDDAPVVNWMMLSSQEMPGHVFRDPDGAAAAALFAVPDDPEAAALARTRITWAMGSTGKFIWPIPDKGLKKRIHRIAATPTLLVWGEDDRLVPRAYADEFARRLPQSRLEIVKGAGHAPHLEQPESTARVVGAFLRT